ncbi:tetratricopeptide repeat protein [Nocardiopsis ganjiahuensis]|uniref:tetratricopeptide repeat protein n=1 Tax=Nocardiopsis ganjiahuensis TaxID=239984 RepID=UPI0003690E45|nr:tetratricopeptide repeat protein [Nocardiopsis ganjiahuensis]
MDTPRSPEDGSPPAVENTLGGDVYGGTVVQGGSVHLDAPVYGGDHHDYRGSTFHTTVVGDRDRRSPGAGGRVLVGTVPEPAAHYQHRAVADRIEEALHGSGTVVVRQVLSGMGGVGKTQLAARHARRALDGDGVPRVDVLVWADAGSRGSVVHAYASAARALRPDAPDDEEDAAGLFLQELRETHLRWLVVWDGLAEPSEVRDLWPPRDRPPGRVVVTTRRRDHSLTTQGRQVVDVGVYSPEEARAFLSRALDEADVPYTPEEVDALAGDLEYLPLALGQAVAYMAEIGLGCTGYLDLFHDRVSTLEQVFPDWDGPVPLAATWELSLEQADTHEPRGLARPLMGLVALLDGAAVPVDVLTAPPVLAHLSVRETGPGVPGDGPGVTEHGVARALASLRRSSLVDRAVSGPSGPAGPTVRSHALVQRAAREHPSTRPTPEGVRALSDGLLHRWGAPVGARAQVLRSNALTLTSHTAGGVPVEEWLWGVRGPVLLFQVGVDLQEAGRDAEALRHWRGLADRARHHLGPHHEATFMCESNAAQSLASVGDPAGAIQAYTRLIAEQERSPGRARPATFTARNNLALARLRAGDPSGAVRDLEDLLVDRTVILGADHPSTLSLLNNLAMVRSEAGDLEGAAQAFEDLLDDQIRLLGPDHPDTLASRHNAADLWGHRGDPARAAAEQQALLTRRIEVLGPDHPTVLLNRRAVSAWLGLAGDPAGAARANEELLADQERIHGPDHPTTLEVRNSLAHWWGESGQAARAVSAFEALLTDQLRVLGARHPNTLSTRQNLAHWRGFLGDARGTVLELEALLPDLTAVEGPDHPSLLRVRNNLASWKYETGDPEGARGDLERLAEDQERVLGRLHPDTLSTRADLCVMLHETGDTTIAALKLLEVSHDQMTVLGGDHPRTRMSMQILDRWGTAPEGDRPGPTEG